MAKTKAKPKPKRTAKKILITGGTGFLGSEIVRQLLDSGEKNLRVMASKIPEWMTDGGAEPFAGSVTSIDDLAGAVKDVEAIFHLAGKVSRNNLDAREMNRVHVEGTRLLCDAACEAGASTMILASSSGTIAVSAEPEIVDETFPPPVEILTRWAYYSSKYFQEHTALSGFTGEGRRLVIMNPSLILGPGDHRLSSTQPVLDFLSKKVPYCPGGGLNFVDVRDASAAFIKALEKGKDQEKYLIGGANMSFSDFFGRLDRLSGVPAPSIRVPKKWAVAGASFIESLYTNWGKAAPVEPSEVDQAEHFWYFDSAKAREELDFDPRDVQETLNDTITYIQKNFLGEGIFTSA